MSAPDMKFRWPVLEGPAEIRFRQAQLSRDRNLVDAVALIAGVTSLVFTWTDLVTLPQGALLSNVLMARGAIIAMCVAVFLAVRRADDALLRDRWVLAWIMTLVAANLFIVANRPPDFIGSASVSVVLVFGIYMMVPLPVPLLFLPALVETVGEFVIFSWVREQLDGPSLLSIYGSLILANALGASGAWRLNRWARERFQAFEDQVEAKDELEQALQEIKVLEGIIPICASCKKVRSDDGFWHQVEVYLTEHSEAHFSHGVCPDCLERDYPDLVDSSDSEA